MKSNVHKHVQKELTPHSSLTRQGVQAVLANKATVQQTYRGKWVDEQRDATNHSLNATSWDEISHVINVSV